MLISEAVEHVNEELGALDLSPLELKVLANVANGKYADVDEEEMRPMTKKAISSLMDKFLVNPYGEITKDGKQALNQTMNREKKFASRLQKKIDGDRSFNRDNPNDNKSYDSNDGKRQF